MNWYVKYKWTEEIAGPMSKDEALAMADRVDGMIFSGDIFSPQFVTTPEVEAVLTGLRGIRQLVGPGLLAISGELLKQAIDTLTLLSAEIFSGDIFPPSEQAPAETSKEVEDLLTRLKSWQNNGEVSVFLRSEIRDAIDMITLLSAKLRTKEVDTPKIVTVPEVQEVIEALHVLCGWTQEDRDFNELLEEVRAVSRRAMDTLTLLLSRLLSVKPQAPTSKEVADLLRTARDMQGQVADQPTCERAWLQRAIDTITLLSVKPRTKEVSTVIAELGELSSSSATRAIALITSLFREKVIECSIRDGFFDVESEMPAGVTLKVRDYDIDGIDAKVPIRGYRLSKDADGNSCVESKFASRG